MPNIKAIKNVKQLEVFCIFTAHEKLTLVNLSSKLVFPSQSFTNFQSLLPNGHTLPVSSIAPASVLLPSCTDKISHLPLARVSLS